MQVTVLIENTSNSDLVCEHGLSLLIEYEGKWILLDAGSTEAFYENAKTLGIDLGKVDISILSHGHYDHSGGFTAFFANNERAKLYVQESAVNTYYSGNGGMHEIGIPRNVLAYQEHFEYVMGSKRIDEGIYLIAHTTTGLEKIGKKARLYKLEEEEIVPDNFMHEQSLVFDTEQGLVIFNSCSHGGVGNIIKEVKAVCDNKKVYAYIGGLHMKGTVDGKEVCAFSEEEVDALCDVIREEQIQKIYTGHCTGLSGLQKMQKRLGDIVCALETGLQFEI